MASHAKKAQQLARSLFKLSVVNGAVSAERVAGVLEYVEKNRPASSLLVLRTYARYIAAEIARNQAIVEHAGAVPDATLAAVAAAMTKKYGRTVTAKSESNPALLAGLRVKVGDDIYESSIAGQLAALAANV